MASTFPPNGDMRLNVNLRSDLHRRLKIRAVQERTTVGELIERWIESQEEPATLSISALSARLGLQVNAKLLHELGFAAFQTNTAKLYKESDFTAICQALVDHIEKRHREHASRSATGD